MKKNIIILIMIIFFFFSTINTIQVKGAITVILVKTPEDYKKYGFEDMGLYYRNDEICSFNMPLIVSNNIGSLKNTDLSYSLLVNNENFNTRFVGYSFKIIASNSNYYLINLNIRCKASNTSHFNIDIIPKVMNYQLTQFAWWNNTYNYMTPIATNPTNHNLGIMANFPIPVVIQNSIGSLSDNGNSIRFITDDNLSLLPFQNDNGTSNFNTTGFNVYWVNITPVLPTSTYCFNVYYNNSGASNAESKNVWDSNYKAVYHFNESTTKNTYDSTINANDGIMNGGANLNTSGKIGNCIRLGGVAGTYVSVPSGAFISSTGTVFGWGKPNGDSADNGLFVIVGVEDAATDYVRTYYAADGKLDSTGRFPATQWQFNSVTSYSTAFHCVVTSWNTNDAVVHYNGNLVFTDTSVTSKALTYNYFDLGASYSHSNPLAGNLDEFRISNIRRNNTWLTIEYNSINNYTTFCVFGNQQVAPTMDVYPPNAIFSLNNTENNLIDEIHNLSFYCSDVEGNTFTGTINFLSYSASLSGTNGTYYYNFTAEFQLNFNRTSLNSPYYVYINLTDSGGLSSRNWGKFETKPLKNISGSSAGVDEMDVTIILNAETIGIILFFVLLAIAWKEESSIYYIMLGIMALTIGVYYVGTTALYSTGLFGGFLGIIFICLSPYFMAMAYRYSFKGGVK